MKPQDLLDRDFYTQLMVMMTIDLKNFNKRFEDLLEEGAIDKVPFFTQELSIQLALAYTVDPKLFGTFVEEFSSEKEHTGWLMGEKTYTEYVIIKPTWSQSFYFAFKS